MENLSKESVHSYLENMGDVEAKAKARMGKYRVEMSLTEGESPDMIETVTASDADDACGKAIGIHKARGKKRLKF